MIKSPDESVMILKCNSSGELNDEELGVSALLARSVATCVIIHLMLSKIPSWSWPQHVDELCSKWEPWPRSSSMEQRGTLVQQVIPVRYQPWKRSALINFVSRITTTVEQRQDYRLTYHHARVSHIQHTHHQCWTWKIEDEVGNSTTESPSTTPSPQACDQFKTDQSCELDESNIIKVFIESYDHKHLKS